VAQHQRVRRAHTRLRVAVCTYLCMLFSARTIRTTNEGRRGRGAGGEGQTNAHEAAREVSIDSAPTHSGRTAFHCTCQIVVSSLPRSLPLACFPFLSSV
jgi:hypothetical protein